MTNSSLKLFNTKRLSSSRNSCLDTSWWARVERTSGSVFGMSDYYCSIIIISVGGLNGCFKGQVSYLFSIPSDWQNINQNKRTLLPKFYGLYCVQAGGKNIRIVVMNNLLPRIIPMHLIYDLKGSTYKRRASPKEREKAVPIYKDLDFIQDLPDGLLLESDNYNALCKTIQRDCLVSTKKNCFSLIFVDIPCTRVYQHTWNYRIHLCALLQYASLSKVPQAQTQVVILSFWRHMKAIFDK